MSTATVVFDELANTGFDVTIMRSYTAPVDTLPSNADFHCSMPVAAARASATEPFSPSE